MHKKLLIGIALQLGLVIQSLGPCLLHNRSARLRRGFCSLDSPGQRLLSLGKYTEVFIPFKVVMESNWIWV